MMGFYTIVGPEVPAGETRSMTYGKGDPFLIEIMDGGLSGLYCLPLLFGSISALLFV